VGIPDLDRSVVDTARHSQARKHNGKALKHHKKSRWSDAIEEYRLGLMENPGHILLRYNLGCAYAMKGERTKALKILEQFSLAEGCHDCQGRLKRSKSDSDFKSLWTDGAFIELTQHANPANVDFKKIARRFLKNMNKAYWALMKRTVDSGYAFAVKGKRGSGQPDRMIRNGSELARWKINIGGKQAHMGPDAGQLARVTCKGSCCTFKGDSHDMWERVADIKTVCFHAVSAEEVYLRRIELKDPI
jgi:hypothetical protein